MKSRRPAAPRGVATSAAGALPRLTALLGFAALVGSAALPGVAQAAAAESQGSPAPATNAHAPAVPAHEPLAVDVNDAWIPEPPPGTDVAAAYFTLSNLGHDPVVLVGVSCPLAKSAMLHRSMVIQGESMMRPVKRLEVQPTHIVTLAPEGLHVMLDGVRERLVVGEQVPLVLHFADGAQYRIIAQVRPLGSQ
ncbi:MAG: copper chaperone PCu(A)C [Steroidobacteraceae bacterium]